eukprot:364303-Chlamydomonas_euryale.AAC.4
MHAIRTPGALAPGARCSSSVAPPRPPVGPRGRAVAGSVGATGSPSWAPQPVDLSSSSLSSSRSGSSSDRLVARAGLFDFLKPGGGGGGKDSARVAELADELGVVAKASGITKAKKEARERIDELVRGSARQGSPSRHHARGAARAQKRALRAPA